MEILNYRSAHSVLELLSFFGFGIIICPELSKYAPGILPALNLFHAVL
jgi:hypothetical protein